MVRTCLTFTALAGLLVPALSYSLAADVTPPTAAPAEVAKPIALMAGETPPKDHLRSSVFLSTKRLPAGSRCRVAVVLDVEPGWHVNTNPSSPSYLTATVVSLKSQHGTKLAGIEYPQGKALRVDGIDEPIRCYDGKVVLFGVLEIPKEAAGMTEELVVEIKFQACNDITCATPTTAKLTGKVAVAQVGERVQPVNVPLFEEKEKQARKP